MCLREIKLTMALGSRGADAEDDDNDLPPELVVSHSSSQFWLLLLAVLIELGVEGNHVVFLVFLGFKVVLNLCENAILCWLSEVFQAEAKKVFVRVFRSTIIDGVLPGIINLKYFLQDKRLGDLERGVFRVLRSLFLKNRFCDLKIKLVCGFSFPLKLFF